MKPIPASQSDSEPYVGEHKTVIEIRRAEHEDAAMMAGIGEAFFHEAGYSMISEYDEAGVEAICNVLVDHGVAVVATAQKYREAPRIVGMAGAGIHQLWLNPETIIATELFWWVGQKWRKWNPSIGAAMLKYLEDSARDAGAVAIQMMCINHLRGDAVGKVLRRNGYMPFEQTYLKRLTVEH